MWGSDRVGQALFLALPPNDHQTWHRLDPAQSCVGVAPALVPGKMLGSCLCWPVLLLRGLCVEQETQVPATMPG